MTWETHLKNKTIDMKEQLINELFHSVKENNPDLVFLSIIAHPKGKEVAFKYFDKFCEIIPAERMVEMLKLNAYKMREFRSEFERIPSDAMRTYSEYLHKELDIRRTSHYSRKPMRVQTFLSKTELTWRWELDANHQQVIESLKKLHRVIVEKKTPWTKEVTVEARTRQGSMGSVGCVIDAWEIWDVLGRPPEFNPEDVDARNPDGWNQVDTSQKYSPNQLGQIIFGYFATGKTMGADKLLLVIHYIEEKRDQANKQAYK